MDTPTFSVSDRAASRIAEILAENRGPENSGAENRGAENAGADTAGAAALRVAVLAGGCSGFQYKFDLDSQTGADDLVIELGAARVVVDAASLDLLAGAQLDYKDELMGSYFAVKNPNATSACGCGTSFSVD